MIRVTIGVMCLLMAVTRNFKFGNPGNTSSIVWPVMKIRMPILSTVVFGQAAFVAWAGVAENAHSILKDTGFKGGLIVVIGCDDPDLITGLHANDTFLVHAIDTDPAEVENARKHIRAKGLYGRVSAAAWNGRTLPYCDNLVNLLIDESGGGQVAGEEITRVLAPGGMSIIQGKSSTKPFPQQIDEWTHYLHDAGNNAVAKDTVVGAPRHVQWRAEPDWTRTHHKLSSISAVVTARGRMFCVLDTATTATFAHVPARWRIVARDAFNGIKLWERDIASWTPINRGFRSGPVQVTRLLVTDGKQVFLPLGNTKPVSALDAATGETLREFEGTENAEELLLVDSKLVVLKSEGPPAQAEQRDRKKRRKANSDDSARNGRSVVVVDVQSGTAISTRGLTGEETPQPQTIASDGKRVYFCSKAGVIALDVQSGNQVWIAPQEGGRFNGSGMDAVLVVADGVVLTPYDGLTAYSAVDGKKLWRQGARLAGFRSPPDIFVINGLVWTGTDFGTAYDVKTGEPAGRIISPEKVETVGHHHRCYRSKASLNYLIGGYRGVEMYDLHGDNHFRNNWVRGSCQYGVMPANGLIYSPSHSCCCYMEAKVFGFYALAPERELPPATRMQDRLEKGPMYGRLANCELQAGNASWPTFRGDGMRRGVSASTVNGEMKPAWSIQAGTRISPPVVSDGIVILSDIGAHTIRAFHEEDGKELWAFTAGGPVDSAPTIAGDAVVFGCLDGNVYCLSAKTGHLAWKFQAAPLVLNNVSRGQLASVWPVNGSVLVKDGKAYFAAGHNTFLDGGMQLHAVDIKSGRLVASNHITTAHGTEHPEGGRGVGGHSQNRWDVKTIEQPDHSDAFSMAGCMNDLMSTDGTSIFLHHLRLNPNLQKQEEKARHIFSTSHFLDDAENHRSHWFLGYGDFSRIAVAYEWMTNGPRFDVMKSIKGIMLAYDDQHAYVVDRGKGGYELRRHKNRPFDPSGPAQRDFVKPGEGAEYEREEWRQLLHVRPRTIVKAGDALVVGGMPTEQNEAFTYEVAEDERAGLIQLFSAEDGEPSGEIRLPAAVVWDGIAPANNKLFVSTVDGKLTCSAKDFP